MMFNLQDDGRFEEGLHRLRPRLTPDQIFGAELVGAEAADREHGAVERQRRNDRVDTRAVGQARVDHRARLVDAAADGADDALDDLHQMPLVFEDDVGRLETAVPFHVDLVVAVDQDVGDQRIVQQHLERAEPEELVQDIVDDVLALVEAERGPFTLALQHAGDQRADLRFRVFPSHTSQPIEVQPVQQFLMDAALQVLVTGVSCVERYGVHRCRSSGVVPVQERSPSSPFSPVDPPAPRALPVSVTPASSMASALNDADKSLWLSRASGRPLCIACKARR